MLWLLYSCTWVWPVVDDETWCCHSIQVGYSAFCEMFFKWNSLNFMQLILHQKLLQWCSETIYESVLMACDCVWCGIRRDRCVKSWKYIPDPQKHSFLHSCSGTIITDLVFSDSEWTGSKYNTLWPCFRSSTLRHKTKSNDIWLFIQRQYCLLTFNVLAALVIVKLPGGVLWIQVTNGDDQIIF